MDSVKTDLSRRTFLGGLMGSVAIAGCRSASVFSDSLPRLRLGLLSDLHLCAEDGDFNKFGDAGTFISALAWFRDQGVDGVVIAGDMADNGMIAQLQKVADAWKVVFPGDRAPDGRRVEKLFVYGNHDLEGQCYDGYDKRFFDQESFRRGQIVTDPAKAWEQVFGEPYSPIWMKTVKGYQVIGAHWIAGKWDGIAGLEKWFTDHAAEIDREKPFFFVQHPHPKNTCFGPSAWGSDGGYSTRALSAYPNAVAFSGHAHCSATDDLFIWQGAFTSIGLGSLRYGSEDNVKSLFANDAKVLNPSRRWKTRQGMLLEVYDREMVLSCRDFFLNEPLREPLVIPLPVAESKPFAFDTRREASAAPCWPKDAAVTATKADDGWRLSFPAARGRVRVMGYEVAVSLSSGAKLVRTVIQPGFDLAPRREAKTIEVTVPAADITGDDPKFSVVAVNCFGKRSVAL